MDLKYKIVRRLLRDDEVSFSRNKNFEAYEDPAVQRALRIYHHLESVESDLLELAPGGDVILDTVDRESDEKLAVKLIFGDSDARRISFLTAKEWELLLENDRVSSILRDLLDEADEETRSVIEETLNDAN